MFMMHKRAFGLTNNLVFLNIELIILKSLRSNK